LKIFYFGEGRKILGRKLSEVEKFWGGKFWGGKFWGGNYLT